MKAILDNLATWLITFVAALGYAASPLLDTLSSSNATLWLVITLVACLAAMLVVVYVRAWRKVADVLEYRTADASALHRDLRDLKLRVPTCPAPAAKSSQAAPRIANLAAHKKNREQAEIEGITAAIRDMGRGTKTDNPNPPGSLARNLWAKGYEQAYVPPRALAAAYNRPVHARAQAANAEA